MFFENAQVYQDGRMQRTDACFLQGRFILSARKDASPVHAPVFSHCLILPGFCDVHVHLREPGFSYKETVRSGTMAGARGGYTALCSMPNLNPVPDCLEHLEMQRAILARDAVIPVYPYGALTVREMGETPAALAEMAPFVLGYSDDGRGVQSESMMRSLMEEAKRLGRIIVAHCEDNSLLHGGYIHDGDYARAHGHRGICSESEWGPIARDLRLAEEVGCAYHVCHISTKESVDLIRQAKARGVDVTCETGPHYLLLSDADLQEDGKFKMNPPLRGEADRTALLEGLLDGTVDMIATDHAPHSADEKAKGLEKSAFGIVGLETAFPALYTGLVRHGILSLARLVEVMSLAPRRRFGITEDAGYCVWDVHTAERVAPAKFASMGRATPFEGKLLFGNNLLTVKDGRAVYIIQ